MTQPHNEPSAISGPVVERAIGANGEPSQVHRLTVVSLAAALATTLLLFVSAVFFSSFDITRRNFDTVGFSLFVCNCLRVLVATALVIILCCGGAIVERLLAVTHWSGTLPAQERLLMRFFLGGGFVIAVMFPLGLMELYYPITAVLLGGALATIGMRELVADSIACRRNFNAWLFCRDTPRWKASVRWLLAAAWGATAFVLLVTRCLYPGETSNDSYEIYWPYQIETVAAHALKPNDLWYMFCSFNGAGINFWSMLITDLLGVQSVTYLFLLAGSLVVFCVGRRAGLGPEAALGAAWVSLQCFAFTNPHWGAFQSHHVQAAAWLMAVVWCVMVFEATGRERCLQPARVGGWMLAALGLFCPLFLVFLLPMLTVLGAVALARRDLRVAKGFGVMIVAGAAAAISLMCLNYLIMGMPLANPISVMWALTDQERFSRWCSPYNVFYLLEGSEDRTTGVSLGGVLQKRPRAWARLLRLSSYGMLVDPRLMVILGALLLWAAMNSRERLQLWLRTAMPLLLPLGTSLLITNTGHPESVYRNYGFICFFIPVILLSGWHCAGRCLPLSLSPAFTSFLLLLTTLSPVQNLERRFIECNERRNSVRTKDFIWFALGRISVQEALVRGDGLWKPAHDARKAVGWDEKVFSLNHPPSIASYLFPGAGLLTEPSRCGLSGRWDTIVFGDAETAQKELQRQGINYFLIDLDHSLVGALPYSPLFEPKTLSERFDVVTQLQRSVLLTWKGGGYSIPELIVNAWKEKTAHNWSTIYDNTKAIYEFNRGKRLPVQRPPHLEKVSGWQ